MLVAIGFVSLFWAPDRPVGALKARWAAPPSAFVEVAGMQVHLRDQGPRDDPEPLVLLHGTADSLHTWTGWVEALKGARRVVTLDLPGFGLTGPFAHDDYSMARYVSFMQALLARIGVDGRKVRCVLAGNSFGGNLAWRVALAHPELVTRLILVDAGGYAANATSIPIGFRVAMTPGINRVMTWALPRGLIESSVKNVYGDPARVTPALVDRYYELALREGNRRAVALRFAHLRPGEMAERIRELTLPTLILWGGRDRLVPPGNARRFAADIRGSELKIFENLGHVPHEEDARVTVAAVARFLEKR